MFFHYLSKNKQKTKRAQQYIKALLLLFDKLHTVYKYNKKPDKLIKELKAFDAANQDLQLVPLGVYISEHARTINQAQLAFLDYLIQLDDYFRAQIVADTGEVATESCSYNNIELFTWFVDKYKRGFYPSIAVNLAAHKNAFEMLEHLITVRKLSPNPPDTQSTPLLHALANKNLKMVRFLIKHGSHVSTDILGAAAFSCAIENHDMPVLLCLMKQLKENQLLLSDITREGLNVIQIAAYHKFFDAIPFFLSEFNRTDCFPKLVFNPTHLLLMHHQVKMAKEMHDQYPMIGLNIKNPTTGATALQTCAVDTNLTKYAIYMIENKICDPNDVDLFGYNVLFVSVMAKNYKLSNYLINEYKQMNLKSLDMYEKHIGHHLARDPKQLKWIHAVLPELDVLHEDVNECTMLDFVLYQGLSHYSVVYAVLMQAYHAKQDLSALFMDQAKQREMLRFFDYILDAENIEKITDVPYSRAWLIDCCFMAIEAKHVDMAKLLWSNLSLDEQTKSLESATAPQLLFLYGLFEAEISTTIIDELLEEALSSGHTKQLVTEAAAVEIKDVLLDEMVSEVATDELKAQTEAVAAEVQEVLLEEIISEVATDELKAQTEVVAAEIQDVLLEEIISEVATDELKAQTEAVAAEIQDVLLDEMILEVATEALKAQAEAKAVKVLYTLQPVLSLPEAFKHPKLKTLIGRFQGLLSHESLLALCAYLYGSGIYNDRANDLDIVLPGINNPAGKSLLKTLTDLLQEQGAIISVIGPDGEFGYKKNDPFRHVIPILWDGIKIDLVVCEGTLLEHMSGLDFTMSANCYDLRNHSYLPSDVEYNMRFQMDLVNRVIDTIYEPMDSFMLDPTRILRAFYILSNCCYSSLSVGCYQAIVGLFKDQKNPFLQPNYYMPPARIHLQLDRILFSANKLHTIYWLTRYDVFQALISYLEKTSPTRPENNNYIESLLQAQGESFQAFSPPPSPQFQPVPGYTNTSASNVLFFHQEPAQEQAADSAAPRPQSIK